MYGMVIQLQTEYLVSEAIHGLGRTGWWGSCSSLTISAARAWRGRSLRAKTPEVDAARVEVIDECEPSE